MNTLTGIEADRVDQILNHDLDRLHILSHIPFNHNQDTSDLKYILPRSIYSTIENLWSSENELQSMFDMGQLEGFVVFTIIIVIIIVVIIIIIISINIFIIFITIII